MAQKLQPRCLNAEFIKMLQLVCTFSFNPLKGRGNYIATSNNMKLVHWPLMGGLLHMVQRGGDWAGWGIRPPTHEQFLQVTVGLCLIEL